MTHVPPQALRAAVMSDLRPVKPLWAPWTRALTSAPLAVAALVLVPKIFGLRDDVSAVGPVLSWGVSVAQALLGVALVGMAMREAVPGRTYAARTIVLALLAAIGIVLTVTFVTFAVSPTIARPAAVVRFFWFCFRDSTIAGLPIVALSAALVARAKALRPAAAGALYGAGSGLVADAAWRLFCDVSDPRHVLAAHGLAVVSLTLAGCCVAWAIEKVRNRKPKATT